MNPKGIFIKKITKRQLSDAGMAFVLILLLLGLLLNNSVFYKIAIPVLIVNMTAPSIFYPFAFIWFGFSKLLGTIISKIILSLIFFIIVTPVGLFRKILGKDSLQLSKFKKGNGSVMINRNYTFSSADIEKPY